MGEGTGVRFRAGLPEGEVVEDPGELRRAKKGPAFGMPAAYGESMRTPECQANITAHITPAVWATLPPPNRPSRGDRHEEVLTGRPCPWQRPGDTLSAPCKALDRRCRFRRLSTSVRSPCAPATGGRTGRGTAPSAASTRRTSANTLPSASRPACST